MDKRLFVCYNIDMAKRPIAFITRSLVDATGQNMWLGIIDECKETHTPIFTFRGPVLGKGQGTILYHIVDQDRFAGILSWASSDVNKETIEYYQKFTQVPLVCLTFKIPGKPVIIMDCVSGMKDLMTHLIKVHGYKKIAFIRGPEAHVYAKERYEGYLESLKEHGIKVDERLISAPGGWSPDEGAKAINVFIDKGIAPGRDFEAVVCVGDNVAIGAQSQLIARGYTVPKDVAVCGYNGSEDAASMNPPLTTVNMPFFEQGVQAVNILNDIKAGRTTQEKYLYKTKLIVSQSCGCRSQSAIKAGSVAFDKNNASVIKENNKHSLFSFAKGTVSNAMQKTLDFSQKNELVETLMELVSSYRYYNADLERFFRPALAELTNKFTKELMSPHTNIEATSEFVSSFDEYLANSTAILKDIGLWQDILSELDGFARTCSTNLNYVEGIIGQCRVTVNETCERTERKKLLLSQLRENNLRQTASSLLTTNDLKMLMDILCKYLPKLKIPGIYVALYKDVKYTQQNPIIPEFSNLILAVRGGERIVLPEGGKEFRTCDILPDTVLPRSDFYSMVVESLHFQENYLGFIVFEHKDESPVIFTALRDYLSSAIYTSVLMQERSRTRNILKTTLKTMSDKADVVARHSKTVTKAVTDISQSMDGVAKNIKEISRNVDTVLTTVDSARSTVTQANKSIMQLVESTHNISRAVDSISNVAQKTDVLALNATIEAAHAGDAGEGFRVVAKEVKELALNTVNSTKQIIDIVKSNNKVTAKTESLISKTDNAINDITQLSSGVMDFITKQVDSTQEISSLLNNAVAGVNEISNAIEEIAKLGDSIKLIN